MSNAEIPNRQWNYLLIDEDGAITGTDSFKVANELAAMDTECVVDIKAGVILTRFGDDQKFPDKHNIPEQTLYQL